MKLFGLNISIARRSAPAQPISQLTSESLAWLRGEDPANHDLPRLACAYEQVVWVYRAVNAIAEQIANVPFLFSRGQRGRESLITSGPLLDFYSRPHPRLNSFQYWELRILWLLLRGECIRIPVFLSHEHGAMPNLSQLKTNNSKLKTVLMLDPCNFQHVIQDNELVGWRYTASGPQSPLPSRVFLPDEVWFDRLPNPFDFWRGLSPLTVAALAAKTDFAASSFMYGLMGNNADTGLIVRSDQQLTDEQQEQICAALRNRRCRAGTINRSLFLWGATDVIVPTLSSADLQFLENRKLSCAEICSAFGVPEEIVTTTDHNKYDVMRGARLNFIENRIAPLCARLEAEEQQTIRAIDPTAVGWFDLDALPIMQQARRDRLAAAKTGFDMGIPFNDLNRIFDLGFHPLPWGNTGYLPSNYQPVGLASPERSGGGLPAPKLNGGPAPTSLTLASQLRDIIASPKQNADHSTT